MSLGLNMLGGMIVFSGIGYFLDQKRGGGVALTLSGMFLGLFYCGYEVWKVIHRLTENSKDNK